MANEIKKDCLYCGREKTVTITVEPPTDKGTLVNMSKCSCGHQSDIIIYLQIANDKKNV